MQNTTSVLTNVQDDDSNLAKVSEYDGSASQQINYIVGKNMICFWWERQFDDDVRKIHPDIIDAEIEKMHESNFPKWLKEHVSYIHQS